MHSTSARIVLLLSIAAIVVSFMSNDNIFKRHELEQERTRLQEQLSRDSEEIHTIRDTLQLLKTNDKFLLEKLAREKYNMSKEGETVYKFVNKEKK